MNAFITSFEQNFNNTGINWNGWIPIKIPLKFVPKGSIDNNSSQ